MARMVGGDDEKGVSDRGCGREEEVEYGMKETQKMAGRNKAWPEEGALIANLWLSP